MQTIIVAEDDIHINEVITEYLKDAGFNVVHFFDGKTAENAITNGTEADLFILDIMLPNITGLALLKAIRENTHYQESAVMMLTAVQDEYTQLLSFEEMADDYVIKPFSPKVLVKRVQALLRRKGPPDTTPLSGVWIDENSYQAYEDGQVVKLTLREFELLKLFLQSPQLVFTRQQLLNQVWGYDFYGDERIVDVHIKNLRKKFKQSIITTVKGVGYRWEA